MLEALSRLIIWLALGDILARIGIIPVPGAVTGLVLLYLDLLWHKNLPDDLVRLADRMLGLFGLLFVPAGVGVIAHADVLRAEFMPIMAAIIGGTIVTLLATIVALSVFKSWARRKRTDTSAREAKLHA